MRSRFVGRWPLALAFLFFTAPGLHAQAAGTLTGRVVDESGRALPGVQVMSVHQTSGATRGALTQSNGRYRIANLPGGTYRVEAHLIGYGVETLEVVVGSGATAVADFELMVEAIPMGAIEVFSSRALDRQTPVAYSDVEKEELRNELGSQDIPLVLNSTPSVYATAGGGGSGDARINVRGFNQRNVAVMLNGVPVNDMENGWVYWSNWSGIGDAASSIQLQRGLSAVNLATPSIGGTLNIITDPVSMARGVSVQQEFGTGDFSKTTVRASSGLIDDRFAFMGSVVRKIADGIHEGVWADEWAYYFAGAWNINPRHRLDLYAMGAPQRHGQNLYRQNLGTYSASFARGLSDYDPAALDRYWQQGRHFNQNWNSVSASYTGVQAVGDDIFERHEVGFLNERENFYHKPQVNLNWYWYLSDALQLSTVAYYSGGEGGGTGTAGSLVWDYSHPARIADWNANIQVNSGTVDRRGNPKPAGRSDGILRNSRNNQWTIGAISKLTWDVEGPFTFQAGLDWRTAEIEHYQEVRDLLGGQYFIDRSSDFWSTAEQQRGLGDKISYDFTNTVDWIGGYVQAEYDQGPLSLYGMGGLSTIQYGYTNHFFDDGTGNELQAETDNIVGYQVKGGAYYELSEAWGLYGNAGYVSKVPIFDGVIDDYAGAVNPEPENETFLSLEGGLSFNSSDQRWNADFNVYRTRWNDRTQTIGVTLENGDDALFNLTGLDALHQGVEAEVGYQALDWLRFDVSGMIADWHYTDDVNGTYRPAPAQPAEPYNFYVADLKVGDAPQRQLRYAASLMPSEDLFFQIAGRTNAAHYADFNPFDRDDAADRMQSWEMPGYTVFDLHAGYDIPRRFLIGDVRLFAHVFNLFDETYVSDATDNSRFNGWDYDHDADDAEVYLGMPRSLNLGVSISF